MQELYGSLEIQKGSIMDVKSFDFFDQKLYVAVAVNSLIWIYYFDKESVEESNFK